MATTHATIGDALIFMTKSGILCLLVAAGLWVLAMLQDDRVSSLRAAVDEHQVTIAELGNKLNECIVRVIEQGAPQPPPGFVLDQPQKGPWTPHQ